MFRTLANAWKIKDLRSKFIFTIIVVLIYRLGACITVPFVDVDMFRAGTLFSSDKTIFGFMNLLSGNAFQQATLFALGVSPYITASIVIQLLGVAFPKLASNDEIGRKRITKITRYVTVGISLITSFGYYMFLRSNNAIFAENRGVFYAIVIIACYCAGSSLVMWLAEKINERGIGNGISIILFANIVSSFGGMVYSMVDKIRFAATLDTNPGRHVIVVSAFVGFVLILMLALMWFIIFTSDSERRIPVQYAKKVVGRKMYGGQNSNLPIKLNMTGVMPIIFASTIVSIPATIAMFAQPEEGSFWAGFVNLFAPTSWFYIILTFVLILAFAYFYVSISFNPNEVSGNLQKNGGSIPGIRPGRATSEFISRVLSRITFIGALTLSVIAILPNILQIIITFIAGKVDAAHVGLYNMSELMFAGTSIIIVVGVLLETVREIEAQMTMRHYKGFLD